ncbi:Na+/H+ antiporter subunit G [Idiomarina xiamenensis]|uniref:Monovalent cation/H+ antiporter subunit G n=1 Tax=Idiomarina xiamenensis 10-D-4 TaxID=740709 RepID=K2KAR7_9GAMM|nr:Na+/H+ antiporter subunit G [Idiomarina xiamenensis]EKE83632.1 monovalent cation/H+ antiporter subunit G [Idiomarina xiamenensis 10-D-4]
MISNLSMQLPQWADWLASFFICLGALFAFIGSLGLAILPDFLTRLHAPTKNTTVGLGGVVLGSIIFFSVAEGAFRIHFILIALFLLLTAPISAHLLAKAALHLDLPRYKKTTDYRTQSYNDELDKKNGA